MLICKIFGHKYEKQNENVSCDKLFGFPESATSNSHRMYRIITRNVCTRCGKIGDVIEISSAFHKVQPVGYFKHLKRKIK